MRRSLSTKRSKFLWSSPAHCFGNSHCENFNISDSSSCILKVNENLYFQGDYDEMVR